jgi:hypothetical protein
VGAADSRAEEASHDTRPVHRPHASSPTILSPDDGYGAPSGRADAGYPLTAPRGLSRGGTAGSAALSSAATRWTWWSAAGLCRGFPRAAGPAADALAPVLSGDA